MVNLEQELSEMISKYNVLACPKLGVAKLYKNGNKKSLPKKHQKMNLRQKKQNIKDGEK